MKTVFGTKEWASHNHNILTGCQHSCTYCFAQSMAVRFGRCTPDQWCKPVLNQKSFDKKWGKKKGTIMFPTTHDIHPDNLPECLETILKMAKPGNDLLIVSKPHISVIEKLCTELTAYRSQILFRFTIGSPNGDTLLLWEPGATTPQERIQCLKLAFMSGYNTSVSMEPLLDTFDNIRFLISEVMPYVTDAIWVGLPNFLMTRLVFNGRTDLKDHAEALLQHWDHARVKHLWEVYNHNPTIKYKDSIKKILGLEIPTQKGLDI